MDFLDILSLIAISINAGALGYVAHAHYAERSRHTKIMLLVLVVVLLNVIGSAVARRVV